ncbi:MAG: hypothetical protein ACYC4Q_04035 [Victivallaceae bacterium]
MRKSLFLLTALALCPFVSFAIDLTLNNGAAYSNITVTQTTPLGINFICNGAAGWADFRDMPPDEASVFGYNPAAGAAFEQQLQNNQGSSLADNASPGDYIPQQALTNADNVPQTAENTITVNPGDSIPYDTQVVYGGGAPQWVNWNGNCYPYNYWHHWYWNHHWVNSNGRYCPAHYYNHHGIWHGGHYYPYKHNLQNNQRQEHRSPMRTNGQSFEHRSGGGLQHSGGGHSGGGHSGGGRR